MSADDLGNSETITPQEALPLGMRWVPVRGVEALDLIKHFELDRDSGDRVLAEATSTLGRCIPPHNPGETTTGLVLGYVQSGKTMSFTTVAALARDNGYPLVIVVTGTSNPLLDQSTSRLEQDLRLQSNRKWQLFRNPKPDTQQKTGDTQSIADVLKDWQDPRLKDHRRKTTLITVLKNTTHLKNLNRVLLQLDLKVTPVLVIDDEADQAGLNTRAGQGEQSTTYQRLVALRQNLPRHSYLQYTATPQAPLLINIIDALSPRFVELLTPGDDYAGGEVFFKQNSSLIRVIPDTEIPGPTNAIQEVPATLLQALRFFFLGVAAGFAGAEDQPAGSKLRNRSMLVHPSRETAGHSQFYHWITQVRLQWLNLLGLQEDDAERAGFIDSFRAEYQDLRSTSSALPEFETLVSELEYSIRQTRVLEVNARPTTPQPDWRDSYPWILVGGQAMDRGYTVEGLTVTYMPRGLGVGNADTIEQRARFFGYKRRYLGLCRVYLEIGVRDAFKSYVEHEQDIRKRLQEHRDQGKPLTEWRRAFFLDSTLRPTRRQVLDLDYRQDTVSDDWFRPKVPHGTQELLDANRSAVSEFVEKHNWIESPGDPRRTAEQVHLVVENVSLKSIYEDLLQPLRLTDERDSQLFTGMLLQLDDFLQAPEHRDTKCTVYLMSKGETRLRSVNDDEEIPTLFQGANYADDAHKDTVYPGDDRERSANGITIQIHMLEVREKNRGRLIADKVPALAVWVPQEIAREWLVQERS